MHRREFLKHGLTLAAGGLMTAGLGGFVVDAQRGAGKSPAPAVGSGGATTTVPGSSSTLSARAPLPDYQEFLQWLKTASLSLDGSRSLSISMESEFAPLALQLRSDDFSRYSGLNDVYDLESYAQQLSTVLLMAGTRSPSYDLFSIDNQNIGALNDALVSPTELSQRYPELTYPGLDLERFSTYAWDNSAIYPPSASPGSPSGGAVFMFPLDMPLLVLYLRTDVYARLGMSLPGTWDEYYEDVVTISKSGATPFGVVNMASGTVSIVYEFLVHLASFGGQLWAVDGDALIPTLSTDQAVAALENYVRFQPYSDPGSAAYAWDDVFDDISRGVAATGIAWHDYYPWVSDPSRSQVTGKIAVSMNPSGPKGSFSTFGGSGVGVSTFSSNQEAAWLWLQWATAKGIQETLLLDQYHVYPSRDDVLDVAEVSTEMDADPGAYAATNLAREIWASSGVTALTSFPSWFQVLTILQRELSEAWTGRASPADALDAAQEAVEALGRITF